MRISAQKPAHSVSFPDIFVVSISKKLNISVLKVNTVTTEKFGTGSTETFGKRGPAPLDLEPGGLPSGHRAFDVALSRILKCINHEMFLLGFCFYDIWKNLFSNSLITHQVKTKKIISVKEVWIPGLN